MSLLAATAGSVPAQVPCVGDCNGDGEVTVDEIIVGVNIALGAAGASSCPAFADNPDEELQIDKLVQAVNAALLGCISVTPSATQAPTGSPTGTATAATTSTASVTPTVEDTPTPSPTPSVEPSHTPNASASELRAHIEGRSVLLTWVNPDPASGNSTVRVLRRLNAAVAGPFDAEADLVYAGEAQAAADDLTQLLPNTAIAAHNYAYAVYACAGEDRCEDTGVSVGVAPTLIEALRGGGYVLHWRHASADVCNDCTALGVAASTTDPDWWKSCDSQCPSVGESCGTAGKAVARQLNATGRAEATTIGDQLRARRVPFGRVIASEFCRNVETAQLMNLGPEIEPEPRITFYVYDEAARCANSYVLLGEVPEPGTNTAIIGHAGFAPTCNVLNELIWGQTAVFKPDGMGGAILVDRVSASQWADLQPPASHD